MRTKFAEVRWSSIRIRFASFKAWPCVSPSNMSSTNNVTFDPDVRFTRRESVIEIPRSKRTFLVKMPYIFTDSNIDVKIFTTGAANKGWYCSSHSQIQDYTMKSTRNQVNYQHLIRYSFNLLWPKFVGIRTDCRSEDSLSTYFAYFQTSDF